MRYVNILVPRGQELLVGYSDRGRPFERGGEFELRGFEMHDSIEKSIEQLAVIRDRRAPGRFMKGLMTPEAPKEFLIAVSAERSSWRRIG